MIFLNVYVFGFMVLIIIYLLRLSLLLYTRMKEAEESSKLWKEIYERNDNISKQRIDRIYYVLSDIFPTNFGPYKSK